MGHATLTTAEIYTRGDTTEKLDAMESIVPPHLARLATECPRLHESQVMRIGRLAGTQETRLLGNKPQMFLVAVTTGRTQCEHALVDPTGLMLAGRKP